MPERLRTLRHCIFSAPAELVDVIHHNDTVVDDNSCKHDESDHCDHADLISGEKQGKQTSGKRQRNREHDNERRQERLELCHHDQIDKYDRQNQHQVQLLHGICYHLILTRHLN